MYTPKFAYSTKNSVKFIQRFINKRDSWIPCIILFSLYIIIIIKYQSDNEKTRLESLEECRFYSSNSLSVDEIKFLIDQLFDPLIDTQSIWNKLIKIWHSILIKFVYDACTYCHKDSSDCYESIDLDHYVYYINESFYPFNKTKYPIGIGIFYYFDLKTIHSVNNSILPTNVSYCDYFHMIQLLINVQLILHQSKIKYFITKGTLIGVLRHHDIIPWDTDIDLFIPLSSTRKILRSFHQISTTTQSNINRSMKDRRSYQQDLVMYRFGNINKATSYKIFSLRSPIVNGTNYRWPKIDIFSYQENSTHIYAYPKRQHNPGIMSYISKDNIEPIYLRLLGPLLVPSPYHPRKSLKAMMRLGRSNAFYACEGNTFLHRYNQKSIEPWRLPCEELHKSYPFVKSQYNSTNGLCYEELISSQQNQSLSLYVYKCDEDLQRTL